MKIKKVILTTLFTSCLLLPLSTSCMANPLILQTEQRDELIQIFDQLETTLLKQEQELLTAKQQQQLSENQINELKSHLTKALNTTDQATLSLEEVKKYWQDYREQKNKEIKQVKKENVLLKLGITYLIYDKLKK